MGMSTGSSGDGATPNINVTPLIDVLLVLLIIFMIISPLKPSRFEAKVPAEPEDEQDVEVKPNPLTLVISIDNATKAVKLNQESVGDTSDTKPLTDRLTAIFTQRTNEGVFRTGTNEIEKNWTNSQTAGAPPWPWTSPGASRTWPSSSTSTGTWPAGTASSTLRAASSWPTSA